jgi:hypothetical protein
MREVEKDDIKKESCLRVTKTSYEDQKERKVIAIV